MPSEHDVTAMLINPIYTISIDHDLVGQHEAIIPRDQWVKTNQLLIKEIGTEEWLTRLLAVLEGGYPTNPGDPTIADGYRLES